MVTSLFSTSVCPRERADCLKGAACWCAQYVLCSAHTEKLVVSIHSLQFATNLSSFCSCPSPSPHACTYLAPRDIKLQPLIEGLEGPTLRETDRQILRPLFCSLLLLSLRILLQMKLANLLKYLLMKTGLGQGTYNEICFFQ